MAEQGKGRKERRRPDLDTVYSINADGSRNFLHPADVSGRWQVLKNLVFMVLLLVYAALPWLVIGGHPAVHVDLPARHAYLFGLSFTNQDFYLMFFVLTGVGFGLFVATALWGRIWCGYACPQTVFMEGVFRKFERWIEGPRVERIRRNLGPPTAGRFWRKLLKHVVFLGGSYVIAHVFLSYFFPPRQLLHVITGSPALHPTAFGWSMFWTAVLYFDFAWFREQTCLIICPYGRLQSSLIDQDTIIIGYDERRGEPRHKGRDEGGDCVDCYRCVEVCPTGIDIRNGLQMECIGCTNCIDACDDVMRRLGKPQGLVRYDSQRAFLGEPRRPLLRARTVVYGCLGLLGLTVATLSAGSREGFQANALRQAGMPYLFEGGRIRNLYNLHLQNKGDRASTYSIALTSGDRPGLELILPQPIVRLDPLEDGQTPLFLYLDRALYTGSFPMTLTVTDSLTGETKDLDVQFRGP
ncbi:MAG: cytochrome c oxidase accessory protein CcoG [bacterium]|nr:cytochrome c oxidase accessory protein CcoG [bacterium]